jgi:polysaccharide export outer membrane protein
MDVSARDGRLASARAWRPTCLLPLALLLAMLAGCAGLPETPAQPMPADEAVWQEYRIAPGDNLTVFVWQDRDLSLNLRVRPDGRISMPLIQDVMAGGRTPSELGRDLSERLKAYVQDPMVTVMVADYVGPIDQQVRVIGEAVRPQSFPYRPDMTLLDALIAVGGLTEFADGNRAILIRRIKGEPMRYRARLADLLQRGEIEANAALAPGDVLIIPESFF